MIKQTLFGLLLLLLTGGTAHAQRTIVTDTVVACSVASTIALSAQSLNMLILVNDSDTVIYVRFGSSAIVGRGIRLNANGGNILLDAKFSWQVLNCIHGGTGTKNLLVNIGAQP